MPFLPIIVADHISGGKAKSSATTAMAMRAGAAVKQRIDLRHVSPGRDSARTQPNALAASVIVARNLNKKRNVSAAAAISGLGPSIARKTAASNVIARLTATHHRVASGVAGRRVSSASVLISSFVSISTPSKPHSYRRQATMERYPHRCLAHAQPFCCLAD